MSSPRTSSSPAGSSSSRARATGSYWTSGRGVWVSTSRPRAFSWSPRAVLEPPARSLEFLDLAYEGADFVVVLDNGRETARQRLEIDERFGGRVETVLLSRTAIEGFYHPEPVTAWLRMLGAEGDDLDGRVAEMLAQQGGPVRALGTLAQEYLGRPFRKVEDGTAIANLTTEARIDPEIKQVLVRVGS